MEGERASSRIGRHVACPASTSSRHNRRYTRDTEEMSGLCLGNIDDTVNN